MRLGKTARIKATVGKAKKGKLAEHVKKLRYISDNPAVATVSSKGKVKGVGGGSCTVYVLTTNGIWKAVTVTVDAKATRIRLRKGATTFKVGETADLSERVKLTPKGAVTALSWTSSNPAVASVNENGALRALAPGRVVVTVGREKSSGEGQSERIGSSRKLVRCQLPPTRLRRATSLEEGGKALFRRQKAPSPRELARSA